MASAASMSRNGHTDCTRARSSRGRPQRGTQGQFREAARTPTARFGSRGSSGPPRSLSGTRCRRPSSEVELRVELCATTATSRVQDAGIDLVHNCAVGFVCDLIDDAVDELTDDLVHTVDDVHPSTPSPAVTPMKLKLPLNDAQLVLSPSEPSILEEVDEDEGICAAAALFTARVAEEAIAAMPASPSWSLHVNAMSQNNASLDSVAQQLDLGAAYEEDVDESSSCDGYEEVYSLASEDEQESDDEHETMAYVKMAVRLAQTAVSRGCKSFAEEDNAVDAQKAEQEAPTPEEIMYERMEYYNAQASPRTEQQQTPYAPRLQAYYNQQASPRMEQQQTLYAPSLQAKASARQALCAALLGRASVFGESMEAENAENVEFLGEEPSCGDELSFDFASCILDGALGQAADTWAKQEEDSGESESEEEDEELEELRLQAMATLSEAVHNGKLEAAFTQVSHDRESQILKAKARETFQNEAVQRQMAHQTDELVLLREKAKETLLKAAHAGNLTPVLKASSEAAEVNALKMKVRNTLCKAAMEGRLTSTLHEVAPVVSELETAKEKVRTALAKGLQNGQLGKIFSELKSDESEARLNAESSPAPTATAVPSPSSETSRPAPDSAKKEAPATPTRTRRRIIGGVVRARAIDFELDLPSASPTSASRSDSNTARRRHSKPGKKSLNEELASQGTCACDRPTSSKAGARLRAASTSAMAMDLGPSSSHTSAPSSSPLRHAFTPSALSLEPKMRVSASLGALPSLKANKGGLLPILSTGKKASAESIAWSMQVSKPTRWGNTGLRGSASMVF